MCTANLSSPLVNSCSPVTVRGRHVHREAGMLPTYGRREAYSRVVGIPPIPQGGLFASLYPGFSQRMVLRHASLYPHSPKEWSSDTPRCASFLQRMVLRHASWCLIFSKEWLSDTPRCASQGVIHPGRYTRPYTQGGIPAHTP